MCIEYDATTYGAMDAEKYPGVQRIRTFWDTCPWSRVTFGLQFIIDPTGQFMLSTGPQRHFRKGEAEVFRQALEESLVRFAKVRRHERGSAAEAEEIAKVEAMCDVEWEKRHPYYYSPDQWTEDIFTSNARVKERFPNILNMPEPSVRRQICELLGRYSVRKEDQRFRPGERYDFFGIGIAKMLDAPEAEVRHAAAVAVHQINGVAVPETDDSAELIASAREVWTKAMKKAGMVEKFDMPAPGSDEG